MPTHERNAIYLEKKRKVEACARQKKPCNNTTMEEAPITYRWR